MHTSYGQQLVNISLITLTLQRAMITINRSLQFQGVGIYTTIEIQAANCANMMLYNVMVIDHVIDV